MTVGTPSTFNGQQLPDTFTGHLANDLSSTATTPRFGFITPNLCDDGHDGTCAGTNVEGGKTGGLVAADLWLKHWMPLILSSPSYESGQMLVAVTFDEGGLTDTTACCNEQPGPNWAYPGFSPLLGTPPTIPGADPGGGRTGALLLNSTYIQPGTVDTTGSYNHYSALRSYEDLLGLTSGGADGLGHLGFAAASGLAPFGQDIFQPAVAPTITTNPLSQTASSGNTLTFSAAASIETPTVQWQASVRRRLHMVKHCGSHITKFYHRSLTAFENGWQVRAVFTNYVGPATSNAAKITVAPSTTVVIPANNATVSGTNVVVDAAASPGANSVLYQLSGMGLTNQAIGTATPTVYGWLALWNSTSVPNGTYTLQSVASYSGAGSGTSGPITVNVNNPPPSTSVVFPTDGAIYNSTTSTNYFDAAASPGVTQVKFTLSGAGSVVLTATPTIYGWIAVLPESAQPQGGCGPITLPVSVESEASYSGGVTGTSAPVNISLIVRVPPSSCL